MRIYKVKVDGVPIHVIDLPEDLDVLKKEFKVEVEEVEGRVEEKKKGIHAYVYLQEAIKRGETLVYEDKKYVVFAKGPHPCYMTPDGYMLLTTGEKTLKSLILDVKGGMECIVDTCELLSIEFTDYAVDPESVEGMEFGSGIILEATKKKRNLKLKVLAPSSLTGTEVGFLIEEIEAILEELEEDAYVMSLSELPPVEEEVFPKEKNTYLSVWI